VLKMDAYRKTAIAEAALAYIATLDKAEQEGK
jgi:hypothetical protein